MSAAVTRALLTAESISLIEHERLVDHESAGATVGFVGNVR
ncbi:molybdenum cofactor biosynthesis protein MoaE, partial [Mycobacteroides abscessus]